MVHPTCSHCSQSFRWTERLWYSHCSESGWSHPRLKRLIFVDSWEVEEGSWQLFMVQKSGQPVEVDRFTVYPTILQGFSTIPGGFLAGFLNHQPYRCVFPVALGGWSRHRKMRYIQRRFLSYWDWHWKSLSIRRWKMGSGHNAEFEPHLLDDIIYMIFFKECSRWDLATWCAECDFFSVEYF